MNPHWRINEAAAGSAVGRSSTSRADGGLLRQTETRQSKAAMSGRLPTAAAAPPPRTDPRGGDEAEAEVEQSRDGRQPSPTAAAASPAAGPRMGGGRCDERMGRRGGEEADERVDLRTTVRRRTEMDGRVAAAAMAQLRKKMGLGKEMPPPGE